MFLKITESCVIASALVCCCVTAYAQSPASEDLVKHYVSVEEVLRDGRFSKAEDAALKAGQAFANEDYQTAVDQYLQAWKEYDSIGKSDFLDSKINNCRAQIIECYKLRAEAIAAEAEKLSQSERYDEAIEMAKKAAAEAVATNQTKLKVEMDEAVKRYTDEKAAVERRNQATPAKLVPDQSEIDAKIETLLAQAKNLYRNNRIVEAKAKYNEVIRLDRTNNIALRGVRACNLALIKDGNTRSNTGTEEMAEAAAYGYVRPIRPVGDAEKQAATAKMPMPKDSSSADELSNRLKHIVLEEVSLSGEQLPEALTIIMDQARQDDPSEQGANIVLIWPEGYYVDEQGNPVQTSFSALSNYTPGAGAAQGAAGGRGGRGGAPSAVMPATAMPMSAGPIGAMPMAAGPIGAMPMGAGGGMPAAGFMAPTMGGGYGVDATATVDPEERRYPRISLNMSKAPLIEVINRICRQANLKYKVDSNAIVIAPRSVAIGDMEVKLFPLKREALLSIDFTSPYQVMAFLSAHGVLFPTGSSAVYDWRNSRLIVNNTAENLEKVEELVETQLNVKDVQVQIQAKFVKVTQNDINELGFEYALSRPLTIAGGTEDTNGQLQFSENNQLMRHLGNGSDHVVNYTGTSNGYNYGVSVYALDWSDSEDALFAPRITTLNGETAMIKMVRRIYFPDDWSESKQTTTQADYSNQLMYSYVGPVPTFDGDPTEIGIQMVVKPEVDMLNRTITMRMTPSVRQFVGWTEYRYELSGSAFPPNPDGSAQVEILREPIFSDIVVDTLVTMRDGGTVVLGGMITDNTEIVDDRIPVLGDVPLVGRFFQSKSEQSKKVHLLIFMTCTLVNPDGSPYFPDSIAIDRTGLPVITEAL
ncbi:MAG: type II secretion system protein GspD [Victivallaceae bacterium]|nr:hypothetical protein [Victivallaceae bacterium]